MKMLVAALLAITVWSSGPAEAAAPFPPEVGGSGRVASAPGHPRAFDPRALEQAKAQADDPAASTRRASVAATASGSGGVYDQQNLTGIVGDGGLTPSDSTGDVGLFYPFNLPVAVRRTVQMTNIGGAASGLFHGQPKTATLREIAGVSRTDCIFDPQIIWDQGWKRWVFAFALQTSDVVGECNDEENFDITGDALVVGISATTNPTWNASGSSSGPWCTFRINTGQDQHDFPKLGHDDNFIIIGTNVYPKYGQGDFLSSAIWAIRKSNPTRGHPCALWSSIKEFGGTASSVLKNSDGEVTFTPVPVSMTDSSPFGYIVSAADPGLAYADRLMLWHLSLVNGAAVLNRDGLISVPRFRIPPSVPQPSTGGRSCRRSGDCIDSGDTRLTQAVARYDPDAHRVAIWTQHTIGDPSINNLSVVRWYEIIPGRSVPRQTGTVSDPSLYLFNAAISPARSGNEAAIFYNAGNSSSGGFVSLRAQTRNRLTPLGRFKGEIVLVTSHNCDSDSSCGVHQDPPDGSTCRWGDYAAARPDPLDANVVWGFGQFVAGHWATQISAVTPGCTTLDMVEGPASGTRITYTARGVAGCDDPRYAFWVRNPAMTETVKQPFSTATTWTLDTAGYAPGAYAVRAGAIQNGDSMLSWEAAGQWSEFTIPQCRVQVLSPSSSGLAAGAAFMFTAASNPECDFPVYQYRYLPPRGSWVLARQYSSDPAWTFDTAGLSPGLYKVEVREERVGDSPAAYENLIDLNITLT